MSPVCPLGNEDRNLIIVNAYTVQFLYQYGQHAVRMDQPGNVTDDDTDRIRWFYDILQRSGAHRMTQCVPYSLFFIFYSVRSGTMQII